jgi:hypothetical protein
MLEDVTPKRELCAVVTHVLWLPLKERAPGHRHESPPAVQWQEACVPIDPSQSCSPRLQQASRTRQCALASVPIRQERVVVACDCEN